MVVVIPSLVFKGLGIIATGGNVYCSSACCLFSQIAPPAHRHALPPALAPWRVYDPPHQQVRMPSLQAFFYPLPWLLIVRVGSFGMSFGCFQFTILIFCFWCNCLSLLAFLKICVGSHHTSCCVHASMYVFPVIAATCLGYIGSCVLWVATNAAHMTRCCHSLSLSLFSRVFFYSSASPTSSPSCTPSSSASLTDSTTSIPTGVQIPYWHSYHFIISLNADVEKIHGAPEVEPFSGFSFAPFVSAKAHCTKTGTVMC